jgi:hypothetical protein
MSYQLSGSNVFRNNAQLTGSQVIRGSGTTSVTGGSSLTSLPTLEEIYLDTQKREADAIAANKKREAEIRGMYDKLLSTYKEGGAMRELGMAEIEKGKTQAIGSGTQQMISSGLYGTTTAASIPVRAEADASMNRLRLEDMLQQRITDLELGKAGFVERINEPMPDMSMLYQAMFAQNAQPAPNPAPIQMYGFGAPSSPSKSLVDKPTATPQTGYTTASSPSVQSSFAPAVSSVSIPKKTGKYWTGEYTKIPT